MNNAKTFLNVKRKEARSRKPSETVNDYLETAVPRSSITSARQASRCMDCGTPFCHWGCPAGNHIPEWNFLMAAGRLKEAYRLLRETNSFPEITGRLCPAPCEHSCVLGISGEAVTIRENELETAENAFEKGFAGPCPPETRTGRKIAVIGSGPAGLAAADVLNSRGHSIVVYEKSDRIGGILRYGIPDFKLEKNILDRRLEILKSEGINFETGAEAGKNISRSFLLEKFDAVCVAAGCREPRDIGIPGRNLEGIYFAMDYLAQSNRAVRGEIIPPGERIDAKNKKVVIIGGGDTGSDCAGTAARQKAGSITQLEILPRPPEKRSMENPWPAYARILRNSSGRDEGAKRMWEVMTEEFIGENNRVNKLRCAGARIETLPGGGIKISRVPGSDFIIEADMVILALGFAGTGKSGVIEQLGLTPDTRGNLPTDSSFMTSREGIFAAGDVRKGQSLIIHAIAEGRECAGHINRFLGIKPIELKRFSG